MEKLSPKRIAVKSFILLLHTLVVLLFMCGAFNCLLIQQNFYFIMATLIFLLYVVIMRCILKKQISFYMSDYDLIIYMYIPLLIALGCVFYLNFESSIKLIIAMTGNK